MVKRIVSRMTGRVGMTLAFLLIAVIMFSGPVDSATSVLASGDLDGNGKTEEYSLTDNVLSVEEEGQMLWRSPQDWHVDGFSLGDADNDGKSNLVFSLWKKGSFGEVKPFWHEGEDVSYKNHLFVYKLEGDTFRPVWCSSDLSRPILSFDVKDHDGDSLNELVVSEGRYKKLAGERYTTDPDAKLRTTVWKWEEWGFIKH
jgi:hypothetical protein